MQTLIREEKIREKIKSSLEMQTLRDCPSCLADLLLGSEGYPPPERVILKKAFKAGWFNEKYPYNTIHFYLFHPTCVKDDNTPLLPPKHFLVWPEAILSYAKRAGLSFLIEEGNPPGEMHGLETVLYASPSQIFERLRSLQPQIGVYPVNTWYGTLPQSVETYVVGNVLSGARTRVYEDSLQFLDTPIADVGEKVYALWKKGGEDQKTNITVPVNLAMAATQLPLSKPAKILLWEVFNIAIKTYDETREGT